MCCIAVNKASLFALLALRSAAAEADFQRLKGGLEAKDSAIVELRRRTDQLQQELARAATEGYGPNPSRVCGGPASCQSLLWQWEHSAEASNSQPPFPCCGHGAVATQCCGQVGIIPTYKATFLSRRGAEITRFDHRESKCMLCARSPSS